MFSFKNWLYNRLPKYFHKEDTLKDINGKGFFIRYVETFGEELDEGFYPFIKNFTDIFDTRKTPERLLGHLSFILGLPPSIDNNFEVYRRVLAYAVAIYKIKGTQRSYELLFDLLGLKIKIQEETPGKAVVYDDEFLYDDGYFYDQDCDHCSYYSILYYDPENPLEPVEQEILDKFSAIICFLEPVNAKLRGYVRTLFIEDEYDLTIEDETIGFEEPTDGAFDDGFDDGFDIGEDE